MFNKPIIAIVTAGALFAAAAAAQQPQPSTETAEPSTRPAAASRVSLAVLDYDAQLPGNAALGSQMADILTARLSVENAFELVERAELDRVIREHQLALSGLVDQENAARVGKLVGAKLLVMGKAFVLDKQLLVVTKVVGVETGRVVGTIRKVDLSKPVSEMVLLVAEDVAGLVRDKGRDLLPSGQQLPDPVGEIRKRLGDAERPAVAVVVTEDHRRREQRPVVVIDPAVETEIKRTLLACGFRVVDTGENDLADWARSRLRGAEVPWPGALSDADMVVVGEGFSEFALRTGDLVTCTARAEINLIDRATGHILLAERKTGRAVDLAEAIAGKTALQQVGRRLGVEVCRALAERVAPRPAASQPPADEPQETDEP